MGNQKELSLARRVQLAVVAHVRHTHTNYDTLLKRGSWAQARQKVEQRSLAKLKEWRDETGDDSGELEETFREVIVLDDDEESSDEETLPAAEREPSMEVVSSRATMRDLQPEPLDPTHGHVPFVSRSSRRTIVLPYTPTSPRYPYHSGPSATYAARQMSRAGLRELPETSAVEPVGLRPSVKEPLALRPEPPQRIQSGRIST